MLDHHPLPEIPGNGIDDDANGWIDDIHGVDPVQNDGDPHDDSPSGHGTMMAGLVAADGDNGIGIASLAGTGTRGSVKIMPIKVLNKDGVGKLSWVLRGLEYSLLHGAKIGLMAFQRHSYGEPDAKLILGQALKQATMMEM